MTASLDKSLALWRLQVSSLEAGGQRYISLCCQSWRTSAFELPQNSPDDLFPSDLWPSFACAAHYCPARGACAAKVRVHGPMDSSLPSQCLVKAGHVQRCATATIALMHVPCGAMGLVPVQVSKHAVHNSPSPALCPTCSWAECWRVASLSLPPHLLCRMWRL